MAENRDINQLIQGYKAVLNGLEKAQGSTEEEQNKAMQEALAVNGYCCGTCVAVSSICVPDATPNKCKGGCTVTSFAF